MATTYGTQAAKVLGLTKSTPSPGFVHASETSFNESVVMASQASGDIIVIGLLPKGAVFIGGNIVVDTSTSTATLAVSTVTLNAVTGAATVASAGAYAAAAAYTTVDVPQPFGKTAVTNVAVTADTYLALVVGTASLPSSGNIKIVIEYAFD